MEKDSPLILYNDTALEFLNTVCNFYKYTYSYNNDRESIRGSLLQQVK